MRSPLSSPVLAAVLSLLAGWACTDADDGGKPDLDALLRGGDCPAPTGPGVTHRGDLTAAETWRAADGVHRVDSLVRILADVTLEACARVEVTQDGSFEVGTSQTAGRLVAAGTFQGGRLLPVLIVAADASRPWGAMVVSARGSLDLSYTVIAGGDKSTSQQNGGGMVRVFGTSPASDRGTPVISRSFRSNWALVSGARSIGVQLRDYAGFTEDSAGLAVRGTTGPALLTELGAATAMPRAVDFSGNTSDELHLDQSRSGTIDVTLKNLGVPYQSVGRLDIQAISPGQVATLTIEPGVTLRMGTGRGDSGLTIGSGDLQGRLVARGRPDAPIVFTSARSPKAKGDWKNISFRAYPATGNVLEYVVVEYAGANSSTVGSGCGPSDNDASILIVGPRPAEAFIRNSTFRFGAGTTGIVSGWTGDGDGPNFKDTNTFEDMPSCSVSRWRTASGCPAGGPTCL